MITEVLQDKYYEKQYEKLIKPFKEKHEKSLFYTSLDSKKLHYLQYENENAKGSVVIVHGFTEYAEKFDEMAYYFYHEGYSVYAPDLRGHGLSYKDKCPKYAVESKSFSLYADDLSVLFKEILPQNLPVFSYTHSLGGMALLLMLQKYPEIKAEKIILSSPMICGKMGMPVFVAGTVARAITKIGRGLTPVPGKCEFQPEKENPDAYSIARGQHSLNQKLNNCEYQTCGPTFSWVMQSVIAKNSVLMSESIKRLDTKMLMILPEIDGQLSRKYQNKFATLCKENKKSLSFYTIPHTRHEIYQSNDREMRIYLKVILDFLK